MRLKIKVFGVSLLILVLLGIVVSFRVIPSTRQAYSLSKSDIEHLETQATQNHDASAAVRLGLFFFYSKEDFEMAEVWYKRAADLGDEKAAQTLKKLRKMKTKPQA
jgi:TPR repeat protein